MIRQGRHLDPELVETDEPLLQDVPGNVGQAEDLEPERRPHGAFWHSRTTLSASGDGRRIHRNRALRAATLGHPYLLAARGRVALAGQGAASASEPIVYIDHSDIREGSLDELKRESNGLWISSPFANLN